MMDRQCCPTIQMPCSRGYIADRPQPTCISAAFDRKIREHGHLFASARDPRRRPAPTTRQRAVPRASACRVLRRALRSPSGLLRFRPTASDDFNRHHRALVSNLE